MTNKIKKEIKKARERSFLAKDFNGFRSQLLDYAQVYFANNIKDFSEASLGGLLLDMAAYVGDTMSFYLDHQFNELDPVRAIERKNVLRHMINAGLEIPGPSPATAECNLYINTDTELSLSGDYVPKKSQLVILKAGTTVNTAGGIVFNITSDINFAETDSEGILKAQVQIIETSDDGNPTQFRLMRKEFCISGNETTESFVIGSEFIPFREITLSNADVTDILSVTDSNGNTYYEVNSLSQDTVFVPVSNIGTDKTQVSKNLEVKAAPRRFTKTRSTTSGYITLQFGSGNAETLDNDIIPDPSKLSLPLYGRNSLKRFSIDPSSILNTKTLGTSPINTTLTIRYRHGGGLSHNVGARSIIEPGILITVFPDDATFSEKSAVRGSVDVFNEHSAAGGDTEPTLDEMRASIVAAKQFQGRIVSKQDVLARIYTLPSEFGRVFRAGITDNPINPLSSRLFILCRDQSGNLGVAPDALKNNIATYLNQFRLVSESLDILDGRVLNFGIRFQIVPSPNANKETVLQSVISELTILYRLRNMQIDQPIVLDDIRYSILQNPGVVSLKNLEVIPRSGNVGDRNYGTEAFQKMSIFKNGLIVGPPGSIFELKFPNHDILGSTT